MHLFRLSTTVAILATALSITACSTVDLDSDKAGSNVADGTSVEQMLNSKDGPLANRSVHFDFDSYTVSPDQMPVVTNHAQFLAAHKNLNVRLEGNTDERGGREYNLALGQKRAEAVKQRMTLMGVSPEQIETISFGKEKPKALGHDEADYYENRRVDINYQPNK